MRAGWGESSTDLPTGKDLFFAKLPAMTSAEKRCEGSCLCGAVQFAVILPAKFCANCHCRNCRRAHGSAFVTFAGFHKDQFELLSGSKQLVRYHTETDATRSFCSVCGTTLAYESPRWEGEIHLSRANIEGDIENPIQAHVYVDHKADWFEITDSLPQVGTTSDGK